MAHYALLDENNIVTQVITGRDENELGINWEEWYGNFHNQKCKRTSYNTKLGKYYDSETGEIHSDQTKAFRKNYAGIGYLYDENLDAFILPKPDDNPSFILNHDTGEWIPPIPEPNVTNEYDIKWNETNVEWEIISIYDIVDEKVRADRIARFQREQNSN